VKTSNLAQGPMLNGVSVAPTTKVRTVSALILLMTDNYNISSWLCPYKQIYVPSFTKSG